MIGQLIIQIIIRSQKVVINELAVKGCEEILINKKFDFICCSCGTGSTIAGIIRSMNKNQQAIGFSALKGNYDLQMNIKKICK